jgi:hypothetical protein
MTVCFFVLASLVATHLFFPKGNMCIDRALKQYLKANSHMLLPNQSEAILLEGYKRFGDTVDSSSRLFVTSNNITDDQSSGTGPSANSSQTEPQGGQPSPPKPRTPEDPQPRSIAANQTEALFRQNRSKLYMKGDIVNFFVISGLPGDVTDPALNPQWPYVHPSKVETNQTHASILAVSEEFYAIRLTKQNYGWFAINHTVPLPIECYTSSFQYGLTFGDSKETVFILDILSTFRSTAEKILTVYSFEQKEYWAWEAWEFKKLDRAFSLGLQSKIYQLIYLTVGLVIVSFAAALYTKVVSMLSPLILYAVLKCCRSIVVQRHPGNLEMFMNHFYKAFTWIGIYLQTIQRNRSNAKFEGFFILAILLTLFFFYFTYICLAHMTSKILFPGSTPNELDGNLFGFMATMELCCMFFYRTRETLYYLPKVTFLTLLAFLLYVNFTAYGYYLKAFFIANWFILACNFYCLGAFEIPAAALRDADFSKPCMARPRALYQPLFSLTWYHDLPPFWTLFIPLYDRNSFAPAEMALLDRNYALLNNHLRNRRQQADRDELN